MARVAVVSGTATAVSNRVSRRQANRWGGQQAQEEYPPQEQYAPPPAAAPADDEPDMIEQLTKLAALKDQGILTEEEFAAQKAKLLTG